MSATVLRAIYDLGLARRTGVARAFGEAVHVEDGAAGAGAARTTLAGWRDRGAGAPALDFTFEEGRAVRVGIAIPLVGWVRSAVASSTTGGDVLEIERSYERRAIDHARVRRGDLARSDAAILDAVASSMDLREVARRARAPRHAVASFVAFLRLVGALDGAAPNAEVEVDRRARALLSLGLERDAPSSSVRASFRRLARRFHPDMHPHAGETERRALARRFAEVRAAYQELTVDG